MQPSDILVSAMAEKPDKDFTLQMIYELCCRPPHSPGLTTAELHSRVSRYIGEARETVRKKHKGKIIVRGDLRYSYRYTTRTR